jgi:hypothetical protein
MQSSPETLSVTETKDLPVQPAELVVEFHLRQQAEEILNGGGKSKEKKNSMFQLARSGMSPMNPMSPFNIRK